MPVEISTSTYIMSRPLGFRLQPLANLITGFDTVEATYLYRVAYY